MKRSNTATLYIVRSDSYKDNIYKIGFTTNSIKSRLKHFNTSSPTNYYPVMEIKFRIINDEKETIEYVKSYSGLEVKQPDKLIIEHKSKPEDFNTSKYKEYYNNILFINTDIAKFRELFIKKFEFFVHNLLHKYKIHNKEFFVCDIECIKEAIRKINKTHIDTIVKACTKRDNIECGMLLDKLIITEHLYGV